jgi:hypothetical protein
MPVAEEGEQDRKSDGEDNKSCADVTPSTASSAPARFFDERLKGVDLRSFLGKRRRWSRRWCRNAHAGTPGWRKLL